MNSIILAGEMLTAWRHFPSIKEQDCLELFFNTLTCIFIISIFWTAPLITRYLSSEH